MSLRVVLRARHANKRSTKLNPKGVVWGCIIIKGCGPTRRGSSSSPRDYDYDISRTFTYDFPSNCFEKEYYNSTSLFVNSPIQDTGDSASNFQMER